MSPTILREGRFRFFFNSREESRMHVHVETSEGAAKFWLEPVITLASHYKLNPKELGEMDAVVRKHAEEFRADWNRHFSL
jgi:hypothetical protein